MSKFHWSDIEMFSESLNIVAYETPAAMTGYLRQYREYGTIERDGFLLVIESDGEYVFITEEGFDPDAIDWTGFDDTKEGLPMTQVIPVGLDPLESGYTGDINANSIYYTGLYRKWETVAICFDEIDAKDIAEFFHQRDKGQYVYAWTDNRKGVTYLVWPNEA